MFQGIDISHYQGTIHFDQVRSHVSWVWAKSSEGLGNDPMYQSYVAGMNANAIPHGSYHFYRESKGVAQIDHWANVDRSKGVRPMLDVEVDPCTERMLDQCLARADQHFGTEVVLYTYDSFINEHSWMRKYHDLRPVNVAKYSQHPPGNSYHIWQNTDSLQIPGFTTQQPDGDVTNDLKWVLTSPPQPQPVPQVSEDNMRLYKRPDGSLWITDGVFAKEMLQGTWDYFMRANIPMLSGENGGVVQDDVHNLFVSGNEVSK